MEQTIAKALFKMNYKKLSSKIRMKYHCCDDNMELEGVGEEDPSSDKCKSINSYHN